MGVENQTEKVKKNLIIKYFILEKNNVLNSVDKRKYLI
jgi:hypothetical protein